MASWIRQHWEPELSGGLVARDRRGGMFGAYVPDLLTGRSVVIDGELSRAAATTEREIRELGRHPAAGGLDGISRFLLRSEAIASSMIEGIAPSAKQIALAELAQTEDVRGFSRQAGLVANNMTVLRQASAQLVETASLTVADIEQLHAALLPDEKHQGLRTVQNWIGGSNWHPLDAEFVPSPADRVAALMSDLVDYLNGSAHGALVQAALVHAQFETIHPFTDGNGRVGRALIHTVLMRRGLNTHAILPVSMVLSTLRDEYVTGLGKYRYDGDPTTSAAVSGVASWIRTFVGAAGTAVQEATRLASEIGELRAAWEERVADARTRRGVRATLRADSATRRCLDQLPESPIMTARTVERILGVSFPAAKAALDELADAEILVRKSIDRGVTGYLAVEILDLLTFAERRLASTQFDTRISPPHPGAAALPEPR